MAFSKELPDEILKDYHSPDDFYEPQGIIKQLTKDRKAVIAGLKNIYLSPSAESTSIALEEFAETWDTKYPMIAKSWRSRWNEVIPFFKFSSEIRKAVLRPTRLSRSITRFKKSSNSSNSQFKKMHFTIHKIPQVVTNLEDFTA
jgi:transposase-like protein